MMLQQCHLFADLHIVHWLQENPVLTMCGHVLCRDCLLSTAQYFK